MLYKTLGWFAWKLGRRYVQRRYGTAVPKTRRAGLMALAGVAGSALLARRRAQQEA